MRVLMPRLLIAALLLGALGFWIAMEFETNARLYANIMPLRERAAQIDRVRAENRRLLAEVARLNTLRREQADVIHSLALKRAEATGQQAPGFKSASEWRNSGNTTPSHAYETYVWAIDHADMGALASVLAITPEQKAKLAAIFSSLPDDARETYGSPEMMFALLYANRNPVWFSATDVSGEILQFGGAATRLTVDLQYPGGQIREHEFYLARSGDGWKKYISNEEADYTVSSQLRIRADRLKVREFSARVSGSASRWIPSKASALKRVGSWTRVRILRNLLTNRFSQMTVLIGSRSPPGSTAIAVLAKNDNRSSDVNLKHLVRGRTNGTTPYAFAS